VQWYDQGIRSDWKDAPSNDVVLNQILDAAKQQVLAFDNGYNWRNNSSLSVDEDGNPVDFPGDYPNDFPGEVPTCLVMAQRMQARNLWNANRVDPQNAQVGDDTFVMRPFPLDWVIKQVIRPKSPLGSFA